MKKSMLHAAMVLFTSLWLPAFPQSDNRSWGNLDPAEIERRWARAQQTPSPVSIRKEPRPDEDTLYCTCTKKQHGWFAPLDTISKETAAHRNLSYRFTHRNKAGNWSRMECVNAYGNYVEGCMAPYILKLGTAADSDSTANREWIDKLRTSCIYEFIADYTGKNIVQERAYDKEMNLIYTYSRVPVGNNQYIGSYKDSYGLPAEMRNDGEYTYGTLVRITEDEYGNDATIQYIDAKGVPKLNSDSADMEHFVYDRYGHILKQQSRNADGTLAIDNWGNCGVEYVWDDNHNYIRATYMNERWEPMRMPPNRGSNGRENVITTNYVYDVYKRQIAEYYTDAQGRPDVNRLGTHKVVTQYDDRGNLIEQRAYDKAGNLSPIDLSGNAIIRFAYDDRGRTTEAFFLDVDQKPVSQPGYMSRFIRRYDPEGKLILERQYAVTDGEERLIGAEEITKEYQYRLWSDGTSRIDSLNDRGETTYIGFYGADGKPKMTDGRASEIYEYDRQEGRTVVTETDYDANGQKVEIDGVCKTVITTDPASCTLTKLYYDADDWLKESYIQQFDKDFNKLLRQYDANAFSHPTRSGGTADVRYYIGDVVYNQKGKFASLLGRDEFGEPDYINSVSTTYYYQKQSSKSDSKYYDENNRLIEDMNVLRDTLPKVLTIEVVDSAAYARGLRDNDVVLLYGDYTVDLDSISTFYQFRRDWALRCILDARKSKRMVVFRIEDASRNRYGLVEIANLEGTPSELGFVAHIRYLTQKQRNRIRRAIADDMTGRSPLLRESDFAKHDDTGNNYIIMAFTDMYRFLRDKPYARQICDPSILLGACIRDREMSWELRSGENTTRFEQMLGSRTHGATAYPTMDFFLTKDMEHVSHLVLDGESVYTIWFGTYISDRDYEQLLALNGEARREMKRLQSQPSEIKTGELCATWQIVPKEGARYAASGRVHLLKNGKCRGMISSYGSLAIGENEAICRLDTDYTGTWHHKGSLITFTPDQADHTTLSCVDLPHADDSWKGRAIAYLNSVCKEEKASILETLTFITPNFGDELFIRTLADTTLTVEDKSAEGTRFVRCASQPDKMNDIAPSRPKRSRQPAEIIKSPAVGRWEKSMHDQGNTRIVLTFQDDNTADLLFQSILGDTLPNSDIRYDVTCFIKMKGRWAIGTDSLTLSYDPSHTRIDGKVEVGVEDPELKAALETEIRKEFERYKQTMGISLLQTNPFDGTMPYTMTSPDELSINGVVLTRVVEEKEFIIAHADVKSGYLIEKGLTGDFIVLKWCNWDCTHNTEEFLKEFEKQKTRKKELLLLPYEESGGELLFKDPLHLKCPKQTLGLRLQRLRVPNAALQRKIYGTFETFTARKRQATMP